MTLNIEGIKGNAVYLKEITDKKSKIICMQEHWLWDCQKHEIKNTCPSYDSHIISQDTNNPISINRMPRGKGGVCILWPKNLPYEVKRVDPKNERIIAIQLVSNITQILIINVYMPSMGISSKKEYQECIDVISNLLSENSRDICILCGDFNATLSEKRNNVHDKIFKKFVKEFNLFHSMESLDKPTFIQHSGNGSSQIDYILSNTSDILEKRSKILDSHLNTSAHAAVELEISIKLTNKTSNQGNQKKSIQNKILWQKKNHSSYNSHITLLVDKRKLIETENLSPNSKFLEISKIIQDSANKHIPQKRIKFRALEKESHHAQNGLLLKVKKH